MTSSNKYGAIDIVGMRDSGKNKKYGAIDISSFKSHPEKDSGDTSLSRYALQIPQGIAEATGPGLLANIASIFGHGESQLDPYEEAQLYEAHKKAGKEFDIEEYEKERQNALSTLPTVSNIARGVEEYTGLPLQPKTEGQELLRMGSSAGKFKSGGLAPKATAAVVAPSTTAGLEYLGVPKEIARPLGYLAGESTGRQVPEISLSKTKPSGLQESRYEKLTEPVKISSKKLEKINQNLENEFRGIADRILEESPIHDIRSALKEGPAYKEMISERFGEVENLAEQIPNRIKSEVVKKRIVDNLEKQKKTGFLSSEKEKAYNKMMKDFIKEIPKVEISPLDLVKQYRKNHASNKELWEPGQSYAYNQAKRQAYMDMNSAISDVIESEFKGSEFSNLFKKNNKDFSMIKDAEAIDGFMDDMFEGKVQFKKGKDFFEKNGMDVPFKRALGKEGFKDFKQLMNDLMTKEEAFKLMKNAESKGFFKDAGQHAVTFFISPKLEAAKLSYDVYKGAKRAWFEMLLDKPQLSFKWDQGVKAMKKGDFKTAEKIYNEMEFLNQKES